MSLRRSLRARTARDDPPPVIDSNTSTRSTRQSRSAVSLSSVTVVRTPSESPEDFRTSIHLIVKMPSKKLREVTSGSSRSAAAARRSHNVFTDNPILTGPRASRSRKKLVEINTSDEEDLDDQEEDEVDDDDVAGEDDEDEDEDADADADADADGDVDMDETPPQVPVPKRHAKAAVTSTPAAKPAKSVEAKEMELEEEDDEDEEDLSEPDTDADGEVDDQDEGVTVNADGGGELDEEEDDDEELDMSDDGTLTAADLSKLTKRQRGSLGNDFLQLPMEPQIKKHLTAEERAMRRAEMARRRKNLSEKRNEEEKMDTINRLLRKQAPKRRGRIPAAETAENAAADQEAAAEYEPADPTFVRWISGREGSQIGVPDEWLGSPAGRIFGGNPRKLVEEI
ncbi:PAPA-1-like conserved region-domain-containing protein [Aspergillus cavernicola]|uniref:PAPA-1-like conserved region-domain-containing protein n=1 Tax=Aspergillus cavernicola TaxID=176166 RepID=A0ABR4IBP5_9EURO